jgi:hypothetical protein
LDPFYLRRLEHVPIMANVSDKDGEPRTINLLGAFIQTGSLTDGIVPREKAVCTAERDAQGLRDLERLRCMSDCEPTCFTGKEANRDRFS